MASDRGAVFDLNIRNRLEPVESSNQRRITRVEIGLVSDHNDPEGEVFYEIELEMAE
jgi:hypothetical protein